MNFAIITNGVVSNLYVSEIALNPEDVQTDTAQIGWSYSGGIFTSPPQPTPPSPTIQEQIYALEAQQTDRMLRESITNVSDVFPAGSPFAGLTSAQALSKIQTQIAALRDQIPIVT